MIALVDGWKVATLEQSKREAELKIRASLIEDNVLVSSQEDIEGLSSRGYGVSENGKLMLAFYESLFLLSRGILVVENKKTGKEVRNLHAKCTTETKAKKQKQILDQYNRKTAILEKYGEKKTKDV